MILAVGPLVFLFLFLWQRRDEISVAWQQRRIFPSRTYWGVAGLYALSGFIPMFSTFGAPHFHIRSGSAFMQTLTVIGFVSLVVVHIAARRLAKPRFEAHAIPARERNEFHGLWMGFWLLGLVVGWLPMFIG
ncbi:MAG: hypothetical protein K2P94_15955 [Rhodospirillaceae bacterium]|nr:hypothetical protein [Rhodospirillaceae bacterium]